MSLCFLNEYWLNCDSQKTISANKHFSALNNLLIQQVGCAGFPEAKLKTKYKGTKKWDLHFPSKSVAIEYKSMSDSLVKENSGGCPSLNHRIEEAIGAAIDLKHMSPHYKLGYIMVFVVRHESTYNKKIFDKTLQAFESMVNNGVYDFFCPLITYGTDRHTELSSKYSFNTFVDGIKNTQESESPLALFMIP